MRTAETLLAIEEIKRLKARYFRCVDLKQWDGFGALFTPDVELDGTRGLSLPDLWAGTWDPPLGEDRVVRGRERVAAVIRWVVGDIRSVHQGFMPEIVVTPDGGASGIWAMTDELRMPDGRLILRGAGHYFETYARLPSGWAIKTSRLERTWLERGEAAAEWPPFGPRRQIA
jgi:SnoaL-like domain